MSRWRNLPGCSSGGIVIWLLFGLVIASFVWGPLSNRLTSRVRISYSEFREQVQAGNVREITVTGQQIEGQLKVAVELEADSGETAPVEAFFTTLPSFGDDELLALLEAGGVEVAAVQELSLIHI